MELGYVNSCQLAECYNSSIEGTGVTVQGDSCRKWLSVQVQGLHSYYWAWDSWDSKRQHRQAPVAPSGHVLPTSSSSEGSHPESWLFLHTTVSPSPLTSFLTTGRLCFPVAAMYSVCKSLNLGIAWAMHLGYLSSFFFLIIFLLILGGVVAFSHLQLPVFELYAQSFSLEICEPPWHSPFSLPLNSGHCQILQIQLQMYSELYTFSDLYSTILHY